MTGRPEFPQCREWPELLDRLKREGITAEFKMKSGTNEAQGIKFNKNGYHFNGSKVDQLFSFSKIDFVLKQNTNGEQKQEATIQPPQKAQLEFSSPDSDSLSSSISGLFYGLLTLSPAYDPEEEAFRRQMQRKKKRKGIRR